LIVVTGTVIRVAWAFAGHGGGWDVENLGIVRGTLAHDPLHVYRLVNPEALRWPYPPGYFLWLAIAGGLSSATGLRYDAVVKLLPIAADAGIAVLAFRAVLRYRSSVRSAAAAAALVSFGPAFATIAGYHGQLDGVAILPALAAAELWERRNDTLIQAVAAGALIGVGVAVKTFPIVVVLALLPTARRWSQAIAVTVTAIVVPALVTLPWYLADPRNVSFALSYRGGWGAGGLSLLVQPTLADGWFNAGSLAPSPLTTALVRAAPLLLGAALLACFVVLVRAAAPPLVAGTVLFLAGYAFGVNFFMQYVVWGLAFAVAAGYLRSVLAIQAALVFPLVVTYGRRPWPQEWVDVPYTIILDGLWEVILGTLIVLIAGLVRVARTSERPAMLPAPQQVAT
jgi:hypothetical protein